MAKARVAILISGRGSNMQALIEACAKPDFPAEAALVISNRPDAEGLARAKDAGVKTRAIHHRDFGRGEDGRRALEAALADALAAANIDVICLAGFMRLFTPDFASRWRGRLVNIHPSLLPAFKGLKVHERTIEAGVRIAGCTVHFVSPEMDSGPIIGQAALAVAPDETPQSLAARILDLEHELYPACLDMWASGRARLTPDERVVFEVKDGVRRRDAVLLNPEAAS